MAVDHGREGIRVNCVAPGPVYTPMVSARDEPERPREPPQGLRPRHRGHRLGHRQRGALPLSDLARYITGQALVVDGGVTLQAPERDSAGHKGQLSHPLPSALHPAPPPSPHPPLPESSSRSRRRRCAGRSRRAQRRCGIDDDAVRVARELVPVAPAVEQVAAARELVDRGRREARLDVQGVARLAEARSGPTASAAPPAPAGCRGRSRSWLT